MKCFTVGLTGGIGSGKSTVATFFAQQGIDIIDADLIARSLLDEKTPFYTQTITHFGPAILQEDGRLDRKKLRTLIFAEPLARLWLENCLHPPILQTIEQQLRHSTSPYTVVVIPLLTEMAPLAFIDRILLVDATQDRQMQRTCLRDEATQVQVEKIIAAQANRQARLTKADDVITNDGSLAELEAKVLALHQRYLEMARR